MKYKFYYNNDICYLTKYSDDIRYEIIANDACTMKINVKDKNVQNLFDFFKNNLTLEILEENVSKIELDYTDIENEEFYTEESFKKLLELIEESKEECNKVLGLYISDFQDECIIQ